MYVPYSYKFKIIFLKGLYFVIMVNSISIGLISECCKDVSGTIEAAISQGFTFICTSLNHPFIRSDEHSELYQCDTDIGTEKLSKRVVGILSRESLDLLQCPESAANGLRFSGLQILYGCHLGVSVILIDLVNPVHQLALLCLQHLPNLHSHTEYWVKVKLSSNDDVHEIYRHWCEFVKLCGFKKQLKLAIHYCGTDDAFSESAFEMFLGQPIGAVILDSTLFAKNKNDLFILHNPLRRFCRNVLYFGCRIVVNHAGSIEETSPFCKYMKHVWKNLEIDQPYSIGTTDFDDMIQMQLQPLSYNLEAGVYGVFELDPVKYALYKEAVKLRIQDIKACDSRIVITVVGAGRGPLVQKCLEACVEENVQYQIYALEKNPNAVITLLTRAKRDWENVQVISGDMRVVSPPEQADILVSELLGSFGDNELSPECLDGAQKFMKPSGVSIPCEYSCYIAPVSAGKAYTEIVDYEATFKHVGDPFQTPYVSKLANHRMISQSKTCFTFRHPKVYAESNDRFASLSFTAESPALVHGFSGYFSCVLYKDVSLSTEPESHTPSLSSWFSFFFPLRETFYANQSDVIEFNIWRLSDERKVWYEWSTTKPFPSFHHNSGGKHCHMLL